VDAIHGAVGTHRERRISLAIEALERELTHDDRVPDRLGRLPEESNNPAQSAVLGIGFIPMNGIVASAEHEPVPDSCRHVRCHNESSVFDHQHVAVLQRAEAMAIIKVVRPCIGVPLLP